jgi:hypothetical protein
MTSMDDHIDRVARRREQLLATVPEPDRGMVSLAATARMHTVGGRPSDALASTVREYQQSPERFREQYARDTARYRRQQDLERGYVRAGLIDLDRIPEA